MLGLDFIRANREAVERAIEVKAVDMKVDDLLALDSDVRGLKTEIEALRAERNAISARFKDAKPEEKAELGRKAKEAGALIEPKEVADAIMFMLTRPRNVTIRDVVVLPSAFDI